VVAAVRAMIEGAPVAGVVGASEAMMARPDSTATLATITVPTLVVAGEEDTISTPNEARGIAAAVPGARLVTIPGAGHLSSLEQPAAFSRAVREFLAAL
jgi:3-oxoadipate enol-lactonase